MKPATRSTRDRADDIDNMLDEAHLPKMSGSMNSPAGRFSRASTSWPMR